MLLQSVSLHKVSEYYCMDFHKDLAQFLGSTAFVPSHLNVNQSLDKLYLLDSVLIKITISIGEAF
ncbi:hypothetical protein TU51_13305 [Bacillus cytotoxicus]|nr:hypothetical protein TU51_13305 [Bacillus cytotoxicus]